MSELTNEAADLIIRLMSENNIQLTGIDREILSKLRCPGFAETGDPVAAKFHAVLYEALTEVGEAISAYLPPDGVSKADCLNRIIYATDNPKFNAAWLYEKATQVIPKNTDPASAEDVLIVAADLVTGNRRESHGEMYESFSQVAAMWTSFLNGRDLTVKPLKPHEVCDMMELLKMSRSTKGDFNHDDYIDRAGYAACAFEVRKRDDETAKGGK